MIKKSPYLPIFNMRFSLGKGDEFWYHMSPEIEIHISTLQHFYFNGVSCYRNWPQCVGGWSGCWWCWWLRYSPWHATVVSCGEYWHHRWQLKMHEWPISILLGTWGNTQRYTQGWCIAIPNQDSVLIRSIGWRMEVSSLFKSRIIRKLHPP